MHLLVRGEPANPSGVRKTPCTPYSSESGHTADAQTSRNLLQARSSAGVMAPPSPQHTPSRVRHSRWPVSQFSQRSVICHRVDARQSLESRSNLTFRRTPLDLHRPRSHYHTSMRYPQRCYGSALSGAFGQHKDLIHPGYHVVSSNERSAERGSMRVGVDRAKDKRWIDRERVGCFFSATASSPARNARSPDSILPQWSASKAWMTELLRGIRTAVSRRIWCKQSLAKLRRNGMQPLLNKTPCSTGETSWASISPSRRILSRANTLDESSSHTSGLVQGCHET